MLPKYHVLLGLIFAFLLFIIYPQMGLVGFVLIFLSSVLIDIDHIIYYVWRKQDFSPFKAYKWFGKRREIWIKLSSNEKRNYSQKYNIPVLIFHGIEILVILSILSYIYPLFFWILIGITIHLIMDYHEMRELGMNYFDKVSQLYVLIKNRNRNKDFL